MLTENFSCLRQNLLLALMLFLLYSSLFQHPNLCNCVWKGCPCHSAWPELPKSDMLVSSWFWSIASYCTSWGRGNVQFSWARHGHETSHAGSLLHFMWCHIHLPPPACHLFSFSDHHHPGRSWPGIHGSHTPPHQPGPLCTYQCLLLLPSWTPTQESLVSKAADGGAQRGFSINFAFFSLVPFFFWS